MALLLIAQAEQSSNIPQISLNGSVPENEINGLTESGASFNQSQPSELVPSQHGSQDDANKVTIYNNEGLEPADSQAVTSVIHPVASGDGQTTFNENSSASGTNGQDGISAGGGQVAAASGGGLTAPPDLIQAPRDPGDGGGQPLSAAVGMPAQPAG
ncbi:MAG: hypothetical protein LBP22_11060, partial [Deltaproteobacteria bacterium]|nr:hypothetical protein [Deltaproteobacteria bacterium]